MDKSEVASVAYRYRRWKLGEDIDLIVRCEHDGMMTGANGEVSFVNIKTLNEWDSRLSGHCNGVDWRKKLDSQRGAVLATELKNNSYKLARWTCCALLAGSEYLKLGYVSRYHVKDSARHVVLGTQQFKPNEFASQINLSMENAWGILRCQVIRVYSLPDGTFSSDEDEEEEEEEEDEEEEAVRIYLSNSTIMTSKLWRLGKKKAPASLLNRRRRGQTSRDAEMLSSTLWRRTPRDSFRTSSPHVNRCRDVEASFSNASRKPLSFSIPSTVRSNTVEERTDQPRSRDAVLNAFMADPMQRQLQNLVSAREHVQRRGG
ncbi:hypothetical protein CRUP_033240 [Coryphaenoides rupestris]|nr:hypothetical protein CRUP_033240 [Coryphaenoides rupestris]